MNTPEDKVASTIYTIVDQLNKGVNQIKDQEQRIEVAQLNYNAGEQALKSTLFHMAAEYFTRGIDLLPTEDCWESAYDLSLSLHDAAQEALFVTGNFTVLRQLNTEVTTHAKSFDDKLNSCKFSFFSLVKYLQNSHH